MRTLLMVDSSATALFCRGMLLKRFEYKVVGKMNAVEILKVMEAAVLAAWTPRCPGQGKAVQRLEQQTG